MEIKEETITVYIAKDKTKFNTEKECKLWETHLILEELHKKLIDCEFHSRCKIKPYFHNRTVEFIGDNFTSKILASNNSYLLVMGRMGNGNDRVRYKLRGSTIAMIKYSTDDNEQEFLCSIPSRWINLEIDELKIEVDKFIKNRK